MSSAAPSSISARSRSTSTRNSPSTAPTARKFATAGAIKGGGADPANAAAFSSFAVSDPIQLNGCDGLKFRPKLNLRLFGATKRNKHPKLRAVLQARGGDANIARASVGLPHALFLDQASLRSICTRVQFAANDCPQKSIYGTARAFTPLLGQPLEGPVYLRSSNNPLPDLVAHLQGQVDIDLVGRIDSFKGGIRTTFDRVPDVPVTKFAMILPGGKHGLLVASTNLCKGKPVKAIIQLKGQNGRKANKRTKLRTPCGKKQQQKARRESTMAIAMIEPLVQFVALAHLIQAKRSVMSSGWEKYRALRRGSVSLNGLQRRELMARRFLIAVAVMALGAVFAAPAANAAFGISNWESLTCAENDETPHRFGKPGQCRLSARPLHQNSASARPRANSSRRRPATRNNGITDFTLNTLTSPGADGFPDGFVKDIVVNTPEGLSVNPEAPPNSARSLNS